MLTTRYKSAFNRVFDPLAEVLVRCGIRPSMVTLGGLALVAGNCAFLLLTRNVVLFCVLTGIFGTFDALDGAVARRSGLATPFGAYLDAICDRYAELLVVCTVAIVTRTWLLSLLLLGGSLLISYAKARAAMEVPVSNSEWPDLMERTERGVVYLVGLMAGSILPWRPLGHGVFWWTLVILVVLVHATALQRILRARGLIQARAAGR